MSGYTPREGRRSEDGRVTVVIEVLEARMVRGRLVMRGVVRALVDHESWDFVVE